MIDDLDNADFISSNVNSSRQEALLFVFEDNEAVINMIINGRSPTMRQVSEPTELLLIGCSMESIWTPKSKSNTLTPKTTSQTKGSFTRDEWNHLLCMFNSSHFSSTNCLEVMSKRTQEESGEERVTAKSRPMMNLVSRCNTRDPNVLASTAAQSPVKTRSESQSPLNSWERIAGKIYAPFKIQPNSFLSMQEDFHQDVGHSSDLDQRRSGIPLVVADHKENGTELLNK